MQRHDFEIALDVATQQRKEHPFEALCALKRILETVGIEAYADIQATAHLELSDAFRTANDLKQARHHARHAVQLVEQVDDEGIVARAHFAMGVCCMYHDFAASRRHLERALQIRRTLPNQVLHVGHTLNALGLLMSCLGEYRTAFTYFSECEEIYRPTGNLVLHGSVSQCKGSALLKMQRYDEAFQAFDRARALFESSHDKAGPVTTRICMATALLGSGRIEDALEILYEARERNRSSDLEYHRAIEGNIACALEQRGELDAAEATLISVFGSTDPSAAVDASLMEIRVMATLLAAMDHVARAKAWMDVGIHKLEGAQPRQTVDFLHTYSRIQALLGQTDEAYELLNRATTLNDTLLAEERKIIGIDLSSNKRTSQMGQLRAAFPVLGESECMACVLFASGMGTKEVAQIMNLSVRTIESIRFRVGKKLGLHSTRELEAAVRAVVMQ